MTARYYLIPGILSCLLMTAGAANAQRGGGGHGGGGGHAGGGAHYGGGGAHYGGAHYGGTRVIYGGGFYGGLGYGGLYGYGYGSPYLYGGGLYNYGYGGYGGANLYASPQYSYYSAPAQDPSVQPVQPTEAPKNAQVKVLVPNGDAKVWFDGAPTTSTGTERLYHTPDLSPTATNSYRIRASWIANGKEVIQEQVINVAPGRGTIVDFTRPPLRKRRPATQGVVSPVK